jgi:hypothetical protein
MVREEVNEQKYGMELILRAAYKVEQFINDNLFLRTYENTTNLKVHV